MTQNPSNDKPMAVYTDEACMRLALAQANMAAEEPAPTIKSNY